MIGPNLMVGVSEVPEELNLAGETIIHGFEEDPSDIVLGTLYALDAAGKVAAVVVFAEAGAQAIRTRSTVSNIQNARTSATAEGAETAAAGDVTTVTENLARGKTPGRGYHLVTEDVAGNTWQKVTTVVSQEGVIVRQHVDFYGRSGTKAYGKASPLRGGNRSRLRQPAEQGGKAQLASNLTRFQSIKIAAERPTLPAAWSGFDEIFPTAPHYARTATVAYRSFVSGQQSPPKTK